MSHSDEDYGRLLIGAWQANPLFGQGKDADYRILLVHHPWSYLAVFDAADIEAIVRQNVDLVLRGHLHRQETRKIQDPDRSWIELPAGAVYAGSKHPNSFQLVELDPDRQFIRVHYRLWKDGRWIPDRNAYQAASDGVATLPLSLSPASRIETKDDKIGELSDPTPYLQDPYTKTEYIDIRGLPVGEGRANRFPIEELFISLTTTRTPDGSDRGGKNIQRGKGRRRSSEKQMAIAADEPRTVPLHEALVHDRLVIVGDPGAGKTTFLRRVANALCREQLGQTSDAGTLLGIRDRTFPVFIRISDLAQHLKQQAKEASAPCDADAPAWLIHYLAGASKDSDTGLDVEFFRHQFDTGQCTVLLDGLDEAPDRLLRERLSHLIENVTSTYSGCRFVVSSRPSAYKGKAVLPNFAHARIDPLSEASVETFLTKWCQAIYVESEKLALDHCRELLDAVRARPEIRRMDRNPVMLTALAVVHWNERRLPEQRADLYSSIITWLSRAREQRPGRATADRTVVVLQELALAMQDSPDGRKTQVPKREAAEMVSGEFNDGKPARDAIRQAEEFLDQEEVDSGIVVARGEEVAFWHLTFQEFMAAKAIASRLEEEQKTILFANREKVYLPDWREVLLLLGGALHQQGKKKVDWLLRSILADLGSSPTLAEEARCVGLISGILRDLQPMKYQVSHPRYGDLLDRVMAIFDHEQSQKVPIEERIAAADALGQAGDPRIDFAREDYWVTIPAGKFLMGNQSKNAKKPNYDKEADDDESPVHEVHLDAYRIARYPVTVSQ